MIKSDMTISEYKNLIDAKLSEYFKADDMPQKGLFDSMRYSLNAGGEAGGRLVSCGTPEQIKNAADSVTGKFI